VLSSRQFHGGQLRSACSRRPARRPYASSKHTEWPLSVRYFTIAEAQGREQLVRSEGGRICCDFNGL
jgi:hypothetical protein